MTTLDSLLATTATHPVAVTVHQHRDWFDWLGLAAVLLVAPLFALRAAREGAKVGGAEARRAAFEAHEREAAEARRLREEEHASRRAQMRARVSRTLSRIVALSEGLPPGDDLQDLTTRGAELRLLSERLERATGDLHLVGSPVLEARIEAFVAALHSGVVGIEAGLAEQRELRQVHSVSALTGHRALSNILHDHDPAPLLATFRALVIGKGNEAVELLGELGRVRET